MSPGEICELFISVVIIIRENSCTHCMVQACSTDQKTKQKQNKTKQNKTKKQKQNKTTTNEQKILKTMCETSK